MTDSYPHVIENGGGERLTFLGVRRGVDGQEHLDVTNDVKPGSGPPFHVHHLQQETLTVTEGRLGYQLMGGPERFAGPGETVTFAPGQMHRFWNAGAGVLKCTGAASPPLNLEYFLTELFASMQRAGGRNPNPLDMAFLLGRYRTEFGVGMIPAPVQNFVFPVMRVIGRITGHYRRFAGAPEPAAAPAKTPSRTTPANIAAQEPE
jgi:quercetin dioxygenase-like cupin family protein